MKKIISLILIITLLFSLAACGQKATATWQEQYDLGVRYLNEGKYEEAVIAFNAAIEIDPKQADAYIGLASVYAAQGYTNKAVEILEKAVAEIGETEELTAAIAEFVPAPETTPEPVPEATSEPSPEPTPEPTPEATPEPTPELTYTERVDESDGSYYISGYDENGNLVLRTFYNADGSIQYYQEYEYDANGNCTRNTYYNADGSCERVYEYDANGNEIKSIWYNADGSIQRYLEYEYDSNGNCTRETSYNADGSIQHYLEYEYDSNGNYIRTTDYNADGTISAVYEY